MKGQHVTVVIAGHECHGVITDLRQMKRRPLRDRISPRTQRAAARVYVKASRKAGLDVPTHIQRLAESEETR